MQTYGIEVPKNLSKMSSAEFLDFILGIQNSVYDGVRSLGMSTPFYHNVNQFLFANHQPITICAVAQQPSVDEV